MKRNDISRPIPTIEPKQNDVTAYEHRSRNDIYQPKSSGQPIKRYLSGGKLGDFMYQLYVVYYNYIKYGKKGIVYLANIGDKFTFGLERTYQDTKEFVLSQNYIEDYQIYNNQKYDINLSNWRELIKEMNEMNWYDIYRAAFDVEWGISKWIDVGKDNTYDSSIFISHSAIRHNKNINMKQIIESLSSTSIYFICFDLSEYQRFIETYHVDISVLVCDTVMDMCRKINSCQLFIGNLSAPLACSIALHKRCIGILPTHPAHYYTDVKLNSNLTKYISSYQVINTQEEIMMILSEFHPTSMSCNNDTNEQILDTDKYCEEPSINVE